MEDLDGMGSCGIEFVSVALNSLAISITVCTVASAKVHLQC